MPAKQDKFAHIISLLVLESLLFMHIMLTKKKQLKFHLILMKLSIKSKTVNVFDPSRKYPRPLLLLPLLAIGLQQESLQQLNFFFISCLPTLMPITKTLRCTSIDKFYWS